MAAVAVHNQRGEGVDMQEIVCYNEGAMKGVAPAGQLGPRPFAFGKLGAI